MLGLPSARNKRYYCDDARRSQINYAVSYRFCPLFMGKPLALLDCDGEVPRKTDHRNRALRCGRR